MLLQKIVNLHEMRNIVSKNQSTLAQLVSAYGEKVYRETPELPQIQNLKRNYQTLIAILSELNEQNINNFSLHFIITISNAYLKHNKIDQAKEILKKSQAYLEGTHIDPILIVSCLNNLANLQKLKNKHYKSLRISLKALEIMHNHMDTLRQKKDKQKLREDAVIYLIILIRCKLTLSTILTKNQSKFFIKAYELVNYLGYRSCLRYLGKDSLFIKRFTPVEKELHLPIFKLEQKSQKKPENQNEKLILEQLNKIHDVLKSKQNPDIILVNSQPNIPNNRIITVNQSQQSIVYNQAQQPPRIPKPIPKEPPKIQIKPIEVPNEQKTISIERELQKLEEVQQEEEKELTEHYVPSESEEEEPIEEPAIAEETIFIDNWTVKLKLQRDKGEPLGRLEIESYRLSTNKKKKQARQEQINEEKLDKIMNLISFEEKLPYEIINEQLNQDQFIEFNIIPFLSVDKEGFVNIHPKCRPLLEPFQIKLFAQESLIFVNHVRNNLFRVSISPLYSFKSICLNLEFTPQSMLTYFTFEEEVNDFFTAIFKSIQNDNKVSSPDSITDKNKACTIVDKEHLVNYLKQILIEFETVITNREDQTAVNQILENQLFYYKYVELNHKKEGMFQIIRYLPGINCFDVYLKNNFNTYTPDGNSKARGNILYKYKDFYTDFGVPLKCSFSKKKLFAYLEIIAKKYTLSTFTYPLTESDQDAYIQNALLQCPITENCFKTRVYKTDKQCTPITISLLTINNEFPVGIKITEFNPEECQSRGFFIHIVPQEWAKPLRKPVAFINKLLFKTFKSEFEFRRDYFLPEWLERKGFDLLFEKLIDPSHFLYLQLNINRFVRGRCLTELFNQNATV